MLHINNYTEALNFYKDTVPCWLKIKILGVSITDGRCNYCKRTDCLNLKTKNNSFTFCNTIKTFFSENIDDLLLGTPAEILKIEEKFNSYKVCTDQKEELNSLFQLGYKKFFQPNYGKQFLNLLNRSTCTYCNRNYTINITPKRASAQLDHWFPKGIFPLLSLSFYNLIPSCPSCNHLKGASNNDKDWWRNLSLQTLLHPYFEESDNVFKFDFSFEKSSDKLFVLFRNIRGSKMENTLNFNHTKDLYQAHADLELRDLYNLRKKYPTNYLKVLLEKLHQEIPNDSEKYRLIFGIEKNEKDYHRRPFSKFKNDIIEKLLET